MGMPELEKELQVGARSVQGEGEEEGQREQRRERQNPEGSWLGTRWETGIPEFAQSPGQEQMPETTFGDAS